MKDNSLVYRVSKEGGVKELLVVYDAIINELIMRNVIKFDIAPLSFCHNIVDAGEDWHIQVRVIKRKELNSEKIKQPNTCP